MADARTEKKGNTCRICGKKIFTTYPQNWPFKDGEDMFCSDDCMSVRARRANRESTIADHAVKKIWKRMRYGSRK